MHKPLSYIDSKFPTFPAFLLGVAGAENENMQKSPPRHAEGQRKWKRRDGRTEGEEEQHTRDERKKKGVWGRGEAQVRTR